jgi:signal transduction histidine kinase
MLKRRMFSLLLITACCLAGSIPVSFLLWHTYALKQYHTLSVLTQQLLSSYPEAEPELMASIKAGLNNHTGGLSSGASVLSAYGYTPEAFAGSCHREVLGFTIIAALSALFLFLLFLKLSRTKYQSRIHRLTKYLEKFHSGGDAAVLAMEEDDFSPLEDEICKTVTELRQTREAALLARQNLADNLAHISHQLKTPLTSISLLAQLPDTDQNNSLFRRIKNQASHLEHLTDALLTLSRIDAGVLPLEQQPVDVYTLLQLSVETLEEELLHKQLQISLPDRGAIQYTGDLEWSLEAVSNIIKNCIRHTPEHGKIQLDYLQNPLYTEVSVCDSGAGIPGKDLPHIFERFYRGEGAAQEGTGIGLSLAKSLIELQHGHIRASNLPEGGACFLLRFYRH